MKLSFVKEDMMAHRHRHELTDAQWAKIEPLLPGKKSDPGRTAADNRLFVNAVVYVLKTGVPWADLPARFGKHDTVRKRFDRWCARGVWEKIARATGDTDLTEVQLDATTIKAHSVASTGRRQGGEKKRTPTRDDASDAAAAG
jgi:putative transposase